MARIITETTTNTGTMTFGSIDEFFAFMNGFDIIRQYVQLNKNAFLAGDIVGVTNVQQAPNIFVHTRTTINETVDSELKNSLPLETYLNIIDQLNWTFERNVRYED